MLGAFNTVYTALQGFFSREFWFSTFLPVALFAAVHTVLAMHMFENVTLLGFKVSFSDTVADGAISGTIIIVILVIISYALLPLLPLFRGLLDGSFLPKGIHYILRARRLREARVGREELDAALDDLGTIKDIVRENQVEGGVLDVAYAAAKKRQTALATAVLEKARVSLQALSDALLLPGALAPPTRAARQAVLNVLGDNNPSRAELKRLRQEKAARFGGSDEVPDQELRNAADSNEVVERFQALAIKAQNEALYRDLNLKARNRLSDAIDVPHATIVGEARYVTEHYPRHVYQVDFEFLWPRLLVAMRAEKSDDPLLDAIEMARAKVDFAVLSLVLATTVPLVWLPVILYREASPWLFLGIGAITPFVLGFFYRLVFEGQLAFGEVVKTAIDRSRFLVLKMLRQAEPVSRSEERELWSRIAAAQEDGRTADLFYERASDSRASS